VTEQYDDALIKNYMSEAIIEAKKGEKLGEIPIGAIIVKNGEIIARAHNLKESVQDPIGHAEILAWRLLDCTLFVTLEPCPMCAGAILQSRIPRVVYGAVDSKAGAVVSLYQLLSDVRLNHRCEVIGGVLAGQCGQVLTEFFERKRKLGKK